MKRQQLKTILAKHKKWLETDGKEGEKAVLAGNDLSHLDELLIGVDLRKADLQKTNFSDSNLSQANLIGADLKGSILIGTNLSKSKLNDANFAKANLTNVNFNEAFGSDADFFNATLVGCKFIKAKLNQADFRKAKFENSDLSDGKFQRAAFNETQISDCKFINADLEEGNFEETMFDNVELSKANFFEANLQEAKFFNSVSKNAYFRSANLMGCKITDTDFEKSNFDNADFFGARIESCRFVSAVLNRANMLKVTLTNPDFADAELSFLIIDESTLDSFSDKIREKFERTWDIRDSEGRPINNYSIIRTVELPREYRQIGIQILGQLGAILQERHKDKISKFNIEQDGLKITMLVETNKEHGKSVEETIEDFGKVVSGKIEIEEFTQNELQLRDIENLLEHISLQQELNHSEIQGKVDELLLSDGRSPTENKDNFISDENFKYELNWTGRNKKKLTAKKAEEIRKEKRNCTAELFVDDESNEVYWNGKLIDDFRGQMYSVLMHFIVNEGRGGDKEYFFRSVWNEASVQIDEESLENRLGVAKTTFNKILLKYDLGKITLRSSGIYGSKKVYNFLPLPKYFLLTKHEIIDDEIDVL